MKLPSPNPPVPYRGLPLPLTVRRLMANPGAFLAAVLGMVFVVALKVFVVRGRPADGDDKGRR